MKNVPYSTKLQTTLDNLLHKPAHTSSDLRQAATTFAAQSIRWESAATTVPPVLQPYLEKVARYAYRVTDADVDQLTNEAHYSEDEIFELTLCAAMGASLVQLEQGLAALQGEISCD
jgi:hypothetical protein